MNWRLLSNYVIAFLFGTLLASGVAKRRPEWFAHNIERRTTVSKPKARLSAFDVLSPSNCVNGRSRKSAGSGTRSRYRRAPTFQSIDGGADSLDA